MHEQRVKEFTGWLKKEHYSFAFITSTANVFYLSNFYCEPHERLLGLALFPTGKALLLCPNMEVGQARASGWQGDILGYDDSENAWDKVAKAITQHSQDNTIIAIEKDHLSLHRADMLANKFPNSNFISADRKLQLMRMVKDEQELTILREAASLADFGVEVGIQALAKGKTEMDILATIEFELKKKGVTSMSFSTIVLAGERSAAPHGIPNLNEIKSGDFVLFDLGVVVEGYCSDITRTVIVDKASEQQKEIYQTVLDGQKAALSISKPSTRIGDVDRAARKVIEDAGYGKYFLHRIGHGLGIDIHESPSMSDNNDDLLVQGMVYTVEPGIYVPRIGGVRIEDDVYITDQGCECLTQFPKNLQIIDL